MNKTSTKTQIILLIFVAISFLLTAKSSWAVDLSFNVRITNPTSKQATITLEVSNIETEQFKLMSLNSTSGYGGINVISLNVKDQNQNPLTVTYISPANSRTEPEVWEIDTTSNTMIEVVYTIETTKTQPWSSPEEPSYYGYIADDFAHFNAEWLFLLPFKYGSDTSKNGIDSLTIDFDIPTGWEVATPWPEENNKFKPLNLKALDFYFVFGSEIFALGNIEIYSKQIGSAEVSTVVYRDWPTLYKEDLAQKVFDIYSYQASIFKDSTDQPYIAIFLPNTDDNGTFGGQGQHGQSTTLDVNRAFGSWTGFSHELIETRWIAYDWGYVGNSCYWYKYGGAHFYAFKTVGQTHIYRSLLLESDENYLRDTFANAYNNYINDFVNIGSDLPLAESDLAGYSIHSTKGVLIHFLISWEIFQRTNGRLTYDDFNQSLHEKHGSKNVRLEESQIMSELEMFTGTDFSDFFDNYIYGTTTIPLGTWMQDVDNDGLTNAEEIFWNTNPNSNDTDNDGILDGTEIGSTLDDINSSTDTNLFQPDTDPVSTTNPLRADTDGDGLDDGEEDTNQNGRVDLGETDPNEKNSKISPAIYQLLLLN